MDTCKTQSLIFVLVIIIVYVPNNYEYLKIMLGSSLFHSKCINPIVVSSFSLVTNSIDNSDKKMFWNT